MGDTWDRDFKNQKKMYNSLSFALSTEKCLEAQYAEWRKLTILWCLLCFQLISRLILKKWKIWTSGAIGSAFVYPHRNFQTSTCDNFFLAIAGRNTDRQKSFFCQFRYWKITLLKYHGIKVIYNTKLKCLFNFFLRNTCICTSIY